jgi:uncharacterized protein
MKYLLVLVVVVVIGWLLLGRRGSSGAGASSRGKPPATPPATMIACAHCGVHLPAAEAVNDAKGQSYCSDAHRLAGPR